MGGRGPEAGEGGGEEKAEGGERVVCKDISRRCDSDTDVHTSDESTIGEDDMSIKILQLLTSSTTERPNAVPSTSSSTQIC